jgi:predicted Zn finger-like uncharacterized protein
MKVSCPTCDAKYTIADEKVLGKKIKVRCKTCSTQILVDGTVPEAANAFGGDSDATQLMRPGTVPLTASALGGDSDATQLIRPSVSPDALPPSSIPAPAESDSWTVNLSESEERTMSTQEIVDSTLRNQLGDEVFVWKDGMGDWALVMDVPELKAAIESARKRVPAASRASTVPRRSATTGSKKASATKTATKTQGPANVAEEQIAVPSESMAPKESASVAPLAAEGTVERRGPIVAAPGSALAKKMASAKAAAASHKSEPVPEQHKELKSEPASKAVTRSEPAPAPKAVTRSEPAPAPKAATRLVTKRPHATHDLFAGIDQAGSEIDVDTSDVGQPDHAKATGARNENSVLFSLDALKSGLVGGAPNSPAKPSAAGPRKKAPGPPTKRLEDLMSFDGAPSLMGGGGLLLSGNDALLTAPAPPPPKPEPKPQPVPDAAALAAAAHYVPPRKKTGLIIAVVVGFGIVGTVGVVLGIKFGSKEAAGTASAELSASLKASAMPSASASPSAGALASSLASAESVPDAAAAMASTHAPSGYVGKVAAGSAAGRTTGESKTPERKPESKATEASSPAGSGAFSKDAAVAALSVAASQATVCKRPEGPWGSGKALVTFAPSGRVTTANIAGAPFGGTPVGGCVASVFRRAKIPPFGGDPVTVSKSFSISP